jgi:hypothetical protein
MPAVLLGKDALWLQKTAGIQQLSLLIGCQALLASAIVTNEGGNPPYEKPPGNSPIILSSPFPKLSLDYKCYIQYNLVG